MNIPGLGKLTLPDLSAYGIDRTVMVALTAAVAAGIVLLIWFLSGGTRIDVTNDAPADGPRSPITGLACTHPDARPLAVMLASDPEARPLSGIAAAELVVEIPVTPNGITRMMAVFQCTEPDEIGSIRSARQDFLGLVRGMDALYAHWGGERDALAALNAGALDNIDALAYEGSVFTRKPGVSPPHNGFTTPEKLRAKAAELGYASSSDAFFWPHRASRPPRSLGRTVGSFTISYPSGSTVRWTYGHSSGLWSRTRDGKPEVDALDDRTVRAGAVIIVETDSEFLREQYISVRLSGTGSAVLYQDGIRTPVAWSRPSPTGMLQFTSEDGIPVALAPGPVWIAVVTPGISVK